MHSQVTSKQSQRDGKPATHTCHIHAVTNAFAGQQPRPIFLLLFTHVQVGSVEDNRSGGGYAYRASKSALNIVNKSMSIDLAGDGISCVLLHPGGLCDRQVSLSGAPSHTRTFLCCERTDNIQGA